MEEPTVNGLLIAAVTGLAGVVTFLYKQQQNRFNDMVQRHDECDDDRRKLWKALYAIHPAAKELKEVD